MKKFNNSFKNDPTAIPMFSGMIIAVFIASILHFVFRLSSSDASLIVVLGIYILVVILWINRKTD